MKKKEPSILVRKIFTNQTIDRIDKKVTLLGPNTAMTVDFFLLFRLITSILFFFTLLYTKELGIIYAPIMTVIFYYLVYKVVLDNNIKERAKDLNIEAVHFFEILILCLEAGDGFEIALRNTTKNIDSELSDEFKQLLKEIKFGKTNNEALKDMSKRMPSDIIKNILLNMAEANKLGTSILDTLNNQLDYLESKRVMNIKEQISKIPVKISIISVVLFIPIILLTILSPVLIDIIT